MRPPGYLFPMSGMATPVNEHAVAQQNSKAAEVITRCSTLFYVQSDKVASAIPARLQIAPPEDRPATPATTVVPEGINEVWGSRQKLCFVMKAVIAFHCLHQKCLTLSGHGWTSPMEANRAEKSLGGTCGVKAHPRGMLKFFFPMLRSLVLVFLTSQTPIFLHTIAGVPHADETLKVGFSAVLCCLSPLLTTQVMWWTLQRALNGYWVRLGRETAIVSLVSWLSENEQPPRFLWIIS